MPASLVRQAFGKAPMFLTHLSLTNFRNYGRLELDLPQGATLLHGYNAQGKTNLLEAIYYLATTRSPHAEHDNQLINWEAASRQEPVVVGRLTADVATREGNVELELRLIREEKGRFGNGQHSFRREALVNRRKVRLIDMLGHLRVVLFLPEDVQLITGSPSRRRRFLDITLCQNDPIYCRTLSKYNKVLEQRNALLRQLADGQANREVLSIYTEELATLGSQLFARRAAFFEDIAHEAQRIHFEELTDSAEAVRLRYAPRMTAGNGDRRTKSSHVDEWLQDHRDNLEAINSRFRQGLAQAQARDLARCSTSVGPHRDDWYFQVGGRDLSPFGSRGQQRTAILALKMAEIHWMSRQAGETPVLLLDEVAAELDERRRALLLSYVRHSSQAILTATDPGMLTAEFMRNATSMTVVGGQIHPDSERQHE